jgi:hypothetical protein
MSRTYHGNLLFISGKIRRDNRLVKAAAKM